jgi:hypothetical protein
MTHLLSERFHRQIRSTGHLQSINISIPESERSNGDSPSTRIAPCAGHVFSVYSNHSVRSRFRSLVFDCVLGRE